MNNIEDKICQAIDIIVQRAISQADYDKTIQATILKCIDQTIGKYTVRYQDSTFYAYSNNSDTSYSEGTLVYVLVPSGDMSKDKTILGAITKLGTDFVTDDLEINKYDIIGDNCIEDKGEIFGLKSYFPRNIVEFLYNKEKPNENKITINEQSLSEYIKESDSIICSATFRTALPAEQQFNGNYGLLIALDFKDNSTGQEITREYVIDVNSMQGNPYRLINDTKQSSAFSIDSANFLRVNYVSIFCYDFPHNKIEDECIEDIWIKNIELKAAKRITEEELNGYSISFITPRGVCFNENHLESDTITIQAQVKVKNKIVDVDSQAIDFYWFVENINVTSQSSSYYQYYNQYGGQGWKCLNQKNIINQQNEEERASIQWVPEKNTWTIAKRDVAAKETLYKCVAVYSGISISKEIKIKKLDSKWDIIIESSGGTNFYFDSGKVNLICNIKNEKIRVENDKLIISDVETEWPVNDSIIEIKSDYLANYINNGILTLTNDEINIGGYTYCWAKINQNDYFETLPETDDLNTQYFEKLKKYNDLKQSIKNETVLVSESKEELESLERDIEEFNKITRVDENIVYNVSGNSLDKFCTFKCSVYKEDILLGTGSITLTNKLTAEGVWNLVIHNGEKIFKYNEYGLSPADTNNIRPIAIEALTFSLYDNLGNKIDENAIRAENIRWTIPTVDTMLETDLEEIYYIDNDDETRTYSNTRTFPYKIANSYDIKKQKNNIRLDVTYKNISLSATTNLVFVKQGDSGTNGSDYICRIVPNCNSIISEIPVAAMNKATNQVEWNFVSDNKKVPFKAQLWHNENIIFNSSFSGKSSEGKDVKIKWSILKNKYDSLTEDTSSFSIEENYGEFSYNGFEENSPANIIKVELEHNDVTYYATLPIITTFVESGYKIKLKENTGFNYVVYSSDGKQPIYDNSTPFEIIVTKEVKGFIEDVSLKETPEYKLDYNWEVLGSIVENRSDNKIEIRNLFIDSYSEKELNKNQKSFKVVDSYDGQCINNAIKCTVTHSNTVIAKIHIPIHFMLNRYGNSAINGWDGNSVNIDTNGGFILAPQAGAGQKEDDNSFTGVLIGKVKEGLNSAEVGLFGYYKGQRSIFLDAKTGTAKFGLNGAGQIVIDPTSNIAKLYSGNYSESNKTGLLIDLTTPEIKFGSGNFSVDKNGKLIAKGNGSEIGGCIIKDNILQVPAAHITGQLVAGQIGAGAITVGELDKALQDIINGASSTAENLDEVISNWCYNNNRTYINGGKIFAGTITADQIAANSITAEKMTIGNFNNLNVIDPDYYNPYNAAITTIDNQKYFQFGSIATAAWWQIRFRLFPLNTKFAVGEKYLFRAKGYKTATGGISLILRFSYNDSKTPQWENAGSVTLNVPSANGDISGILTINTLPTAGRLLSQIELFAEIGNTTGLCYMRDITIYQMGSSELIVNGSITADKITTNDLIGTSGRINLSKGTFDYGNGKLKFDGSTLIVDGKITATTGTIGNWTISGSSLYKNKDSFGAAGSNNMYLGNEGISISNTFKVTKEGVLTATGATISGAITATSLTLGAGVTVAAGSVSGLSNVAKTGSYNDLSNKPSIPSLTGYIRTDGTIGKTPEDGATGFKVSSEGKLEAANAIIYGTIYASAGTIGGCVIKNNTLTITNANISGTISADKINANSLTIGKLDVSTRNLIEGAAKQIYHTADASSGTAGYFLFAEIKISGAYQNQPIKISGINRGGVPSTVWITFVNSSTSDPNLARFAKSGTANFYILKVTTGTWNLYVQKTEGYDQFSVTEYEKTAYMSATTVTWKNSCVTSLPSNCTTAKQTVSTAEWCYNNDITWFNGGNIYAGTVTADKITANNIEGDYGWINLRNGTFNYGKGKLKFDGTSLTIKGGVTATDCLVKHVIYFYNSLESNKSSCISSNGSKIIIGADEEGNVISQIGNGLDSYGNFRVIGGSIYENGTALSSKYAPISHNHNYLPISGGALTGSLTLPLGDSGYDANTNTVFADGLKFAQGSTAMIFSNASQQLTFYASAEYEFGLFFGVTKIGNATDRWTLAPIKSGALHLGSPYYKWKEVHAETGAIQTSDAKQKNNILPLSIEYEKIFNQLKPVSYKFNNGKRTHTGFISQDIEESIQNVGLTGEDWAAFCKDENENGNFIYGLRYDEIIALNTHMIQKLMNRVNELEKQLQ